MSHKSRPLDELDESLAKMRQYRDELRKKNEWLTKHRYKIWAVYFVFLALILWGIFR